MNLKIKQSHAFINIFFLSYIKPLWALSLSVVLMLNKRRVFYLICIIILSFFFFFSNFLLSFFILNNANYNYCGYLVASNMLPIASLTFLSCSVFFMGVLGIIINQKNFINLIISIELMLLGAILNLIFFSTYYLDPTGEVFALFVVATAAADSAIGLAILIAAYSTRSNINIYTFYTLRG